MQKPPLHVVQAYGWEWKTSTKVVHTLIVVVGVATNSTRVPHKVLARAVSEG